MDLSFLLQYTLYSAIPLMIVALGGMFSEKSGVVNIALEGLMLIGGLFGIILLHTLEGVSQLNTLNLILSCLFAGIITAAFSLIHSFAAINLKADQVISATAINIFSIAFVMIFARAFNDSISTEIGFDRVKYIIEILGVKVNFGLVLGIIILVASYIIIYKTKLGLRIRSCGEYPQAADSVGINVAKIRYIGVTISGFLAGIGGTLYFISLNIVFLPTVSGYGFLALAVLISGKWKPINIAISALIFSVFITLGSTASSIPLFMSLPFPEEFYGALPYILTIIVLAFTSKNSAAPRAAGEPYDVSKR